MNLTGPIVKGHGRGGRLLGFPTFNLEVPEGFEMEHGIYAAWVHIREVRYMGALHYGPIPAFNDPKPSFEVFVLDYEPDGTVGAIAVEPVKWLRAIRDFDDLEALSQQIAVDVDDTRLALAGL